MSKTISGKIGEEPNVKMQKVTECQSLDLTEDQKECLNSLLSACQIIIINVVRTCMELKKKSKICVDRVRKLAQEIVKKNNLKSSLRSKGNLDSIRFITDLNVNVKLEK